MSEPIWCTVRFRTPRGWGSNNPLVEGMSEALINGDIFDADQDGDAPYEWVVNGEGSYGLLDGDVEFWLDWMRAHKIPFIASDEPKYEYEGTTIVNDGFKEWSGQSSSEQAVLSRTEYNAIQAGTSQFTSVEQFFDILNTNTLEGFSIDHLPETFPYDEAAPEPEPDDDDGLCQFTVNMPGYLSIGIDARAGRQVSGTRDELLLLARNIHDALEGEDDEHVSG